MIRAVSQTPHLPAGSTPTTPQPRLNPSVFKAAASSGSPHVSAAAPHAPKYPPIKTADAGPDGPSARATASSIVVPASTSRTPGLLTPPATVIRSVPAAPRRPADRNQASP